MVFVKRPAALLGIIPVAGEVAEDYLQPLFVVTHLAPGQRRTQILQRREATFKPDVPVQLSCSPPDAGSSSLAWERKRLLIE